MLFRSLAFLALQQLVHEKGEPLIKAWFHPQDSRLSDYLLNFLAWGFIGLLKEWFDQGMALSRKELLAAAQRMAEGSAAGLFSREEGRKPS